MKKTAAMLLAIAMLAAMAIACAGTSNTPAQPTAQPAAETPAATDNPADTAETDQEAADRVAALIDAIYVQTRTEETDAQCEAAKAAWDALTDAQKELVEGEEADPDYFGRDTGDASKDNPRNQDGIGDNELLVVSFGTSFNESRAWDIGGIEAALEKAFPDWSVRRAFTAQIIINHVQARDGEKIDNMEQALERAVENGVKNLVIQPTHLMHGAEYDELCAAVEAYADKFETVTVAEPLLGQVGADASQVNADKRTVAIAAVADAVQTEGYNTLQQAEADGIAFVFMGHGTSHSAKVTYSQMQTQMDKLGYKNVFIGTVEGEPEETSCENIIAKVHEAGYTKVVLQPLMVVAGDHANNDMADEEDPESWKSQFVASGHFEKVDCNISGLGRIEAVEAIYVSHAKTAILSVAPVGESDEAAAARVAALIDAIYVQERTADTDAQCAAAKKAWDALTDAQKELVEGEEADPDYFGRDTGDATLDDPRNADEIGENELLVVSFGTSFNESRAMDIGGIEAALQKAYPDWSVRRAFTAQIIINHVQAREGEFIDNMEQALDRAVENGVKHLVVQPTHLMHGAEYDELCAMVAIYSDKFETVKIAEPLLGEVGADASVTNNDKERVAKAAVADAVAANGFASLEEAEAAGTAFVFMGHGTAHKAKVTYSQMQTMMNDLGYKNVFIGTVEGEPEETSCENIIARVHEAGYKYVALQPLMVVAGDHANNDMADPDDPESWLSQFAASGYFDGVECNISGLGRIEEVQAMYIEHTGAAIEAAAPAADSQTAGATGALADGVYSAEFHTDSSMFHVNEANNGLGVLTVKDGQMVIHVSLVSKSIVNLYVGTAEDAQKDGAVLLEPTVDTVTYDDGTTEEVYGFDIPVSVIGEDFDLAILGKSGKWFDHKVSVTNPVAQN